MTGNSRALATTMDVCVLVRLLSDVHALEEQNDPDGAQALLRRFRVLLQPEEARIALSVALSALAVLSGGNPEVLVDALPLKAIFDDVLADMGGSEA